jgi:hypothetical protein
MLKAAGYVTHEIPYFGRSQPSRQFVPRLGPETSVLVFILTPPRSESFVRYPNKTSIDVLQNEKFTAKQQRPTRESP